MDYAISGRDDYDTGHFILAVAGGQTASQEGGTSRELLNTTPCQKTKLDLNE
jgi:hypothetical protein